ILGHQLAAVEGWFIVPLDALTQVEDIHRIIQLFPAFRHIRLHREDAGLHPRADFMAHEAAVNEAQRGMRLETDSQMRIKVCGVIAAYTQDAAVLGRSCFGPPERRWT